MAVNDIPVMLKRVTIAIMRKRHPFPVAFEIARGSLTNQGFLMKGSEKGAVHHIKLTAKGMQQNREHMRKPAREVREFDRLFAKYGARFGGATAPEPNREDQT